MEPVLQKLRILNQGKKLKIGQFEVEGVDIDNGSKEIVLKGKECIKYPKDKEVRFAFERDLSNFNPL